MKNGAKKSNYLVDKLKSKKILRLKKNINFVEKLQNNFTHFFEQYLKFHTLNIYLIQLILSISNQQTFLYVVQQF